MGARGYVVVRTHDTHDRKCVFWVECVLRVERSTEGRSVLMAAVTLTTRSESVRNAVGEKLVEDEGEGGELRDGEGDKLLEGEGEKLAVDEGEGEKLLEGEGEGEELLEGEGDGVLEGGRRVALTEHRAELGFRQSASCRSSSPLPIATHCRASVGQPLNGWPTAHTAPGLAHTQAGSSPLVNCQQQVRFVVPPRSWALRPIQHSGAVRGHSARARSISSRDWMAARVAAGASAGQAVSL
jgi:hypothetical protein